MKHKSKIEKIETKIVEIFLTQEEFHEYSELESWDALEFIDEYAELDVPCNTNHTTWFEYDDHKYHFIDDNTGEYWQLHVMLEAV